MPVVSKTAAHQRGFTLVELVVTIVLIGILGTGVASFIGNTTKGMVDTAERSQVANIALLLSEQLSRHLRHALPNSIRISTDGSCIEFIPVFAGTNYLAAPVLFSANQFEVVPFHSIPVGFNFSAKPLRVAIYPANQTGLYSPGTNSVISSSISQLTTGSTANAHALQLSATHQFPADSPSKRLFLVEAPVMFCFQSGLLYRYHDYGFNGTFSNTGLSNQTVYGSKVYAGQFAYSPSTLKRNAVVNIRFEIRGKDNLVQAVNQEVQIRNVP